MSEHPNVASYRRFLNEWLPEALGSLVDLADYAVEARYPVFGEPVSRKEHADALALARRCVSWARSQLRAK